MDLSVPPVTAPTKGKMKNYLDGVGTLPEGPQKRTLDEYKEYVGREKRAKLDVPEQAGSEAEAEGEPEEGEESGKEEEEGEEGEKEGEDGGKEEEKEGKGKTEEREEEKEKGMELKGQKKKAKSPDIIVPDTLESLQDFMLSKNGVRKRDRQLDYDLGSTSHNFVHHSTAITPISLPVQNPVPHHHNPRLQPPHLLQLQAYRP